MSTLTIAAVALLASMLTFYSGFGLGTVLLPVFCLWYPVEQSIAMTALIHLASSVFKVVSVGRFADRTVVILFGLPAMVGAFLGAWALSKLTHVSQPSGAAPWIKTVLGTLMVGFAVFEIIFGNIAYRGPLWIGGIASGFAGGLSGHQGALRSLYLKGLSLSKESFVGTGALLACLVDVTRLFSYFQKLETRWISEPSVIVSVGTALLGTWASNRYLKKVSLSAIHYLVSAFVIVIGGLMIVGKI